MNFKANSYKSLNQQIAARFAFNNEEDVKNFVNFKFQRITKQNLKILNLNSKRIITKRNCP